MTSSSKTPFFSGKLLTLATAALALSAVPAFGQVSAPTLQPIAYSSSSSGTNPFAGDDIDGRSLASAPSGMKVAPQYGGGYGGGHYHQYSDNSAASHFAFEIGAGLTAPIGNDANGGFTSFVDNGQRYGTITYGGNLMGGAGWHFTKRFTLLGEISFNDNKIPGRTLSAINNAGIGAPQLGGNVHTFGYTAEALYTYFEKDRSPFSGYVIGGGGFYHKSTNFTVPVQQCSYIYGYCGYVNQTLSSFTDNGAGFNLGTGVAIKPFGQYSRAKLFAEARYVFVDTPRYDFTKSNESYHTGTEGLIPITIGLRF